MTEPRLTAADHVFAHALACIVLPVVKDADEEAWMTDIAVSLLPRITTTVATMRTLALAFAEYRAQADGARWAGEARLREALWSFNRWRVANGMDAMTAAAA
jgi:hypothetical protein